MDLLERVLGSPEKRTEYQDFIDRYDAAPPYDTIEDREAVDRYGQVTPELSRDQYRDSATEAFGKLSPTERAEFSRWLRTRASEQGVSVPDYDLNDDGIDDRAQKDPGELAEVTTRVREHLRADPRQGRHRGPVRQSDRQDRCRGYRRYGGLAPDGRSPLIGIWCAVDRTPPHTVTAMQRRRPGH